MTEEVGRAVEETLLEKVTGWVVSRLRPLPSDIETEGSSTPFSSALLQREHVPWNWVALHVVTLLAKYPGGITRAILLSELQALWDECSSEWQHGLSGKLESIDRLWCTKTLPLAAILEVSIATIQRVPHTQIFLLSLKDERSKKTIEWYMPQKLYSLASAPGSLLTEKRKLRLTGCRTVCTAQSMRLLPTDYSVILLNAEDEDWVLNHFTDKLQDLTPFRASHDYRLWVKVECIQSVRTQAYGHHLEVDVTIRDARATTLSHGSFVPAPFVATLVLWDDQVNMASLFKKHDQLAIFSPVAPHWQKHHRMEYGPKTIIYVLPSSPPQEVVGSSSVESSHQTYSVPRDENGHLDYSHYPERILLRHIKPNMTYLTLYGRVQMMRPNQPLLNSGGHQHERDARRGSTAATPRTDRFAVRIQDSTGAHQDVTLWGSVGRAFSVSRPGHLVLMENVTSSPRKEAKGKFYLLCAAAQKGRCYNVSMLKGTLASSDFLDITVLRDARHIKNYVCRAAVVGWHLPSSERGLLQTVHTTCLREVRQQEGYSSEFCCDFCAVQIESGDDLKKVFNVQWRLDDGTGSVLASAMPSVQVDMIQVAPHTFEGLPRSEQKGRLDEVIGQEFLCTMSQYPDEHGKPAHRIDQIAPVNASAIATALLKQLQGASTRNH
ncbi:hypothetical protein QOT17_011042 [Balamuthia mandrillaris]